MKISYEQKLQKVTKGMRNINFHLLAKSAKLAGNSRNDDFFMYWLNMRTTKRTKSKISIT